MRLKAITTLWGRWTEPNPTIADSRQRQQSRLLASLLLIGVISTIFMTVLPNVLEPPPTLINNQILAGILNVGLLVALYHLARQGRYQFVALLTSVLATCSVVAAAFLMGRSDGLRTLYYLSIVIVFSSLFLSRRATLGVFTLQIILMIAFGTLATGVRFGEMMQSAVIFNVLMTVITLLIVGHRNQWDREQRVRLVENERRHRVIADMLADYAYVLRVETDGSMRQDWLSESTNRLIDLGFDLTQLQDTVQYFHPDDQEQARRHFDALLSGSVQRDELRFMFQDHEYWLRLTHLPVSDDDRVTQIYGAVQNITDHKIAQQRQFEEALARERYELVHGFFRAVSHDFRTSLSVIKTNQYLIQTLVKRGEYDTLDNRLNLINDQVDRLTRQLENLKLVSALNSPTKACNPNDLMQAEISGYAEQIAAKSLDVAFIPDPNAPLIAVNPDEMQRAVGHLLENAIHFTPAKGRIEMCVEHQAEQVMMRISDTGTGISLDEQERIFEFFYRGDEARSIESGGIGLGLSIAKIVAEAYGGQLTVNSAPGNGSTFTLTIPVV